MNAFLKINFYLSCKKKKNFFIKNKWSQMKIFQNINNFNIISIKLKLMVS